MTEKFVMAINFYRILTENNPVMGDSKTFGIPEVKGLNDFDHNSYLPPPGFNAYYTTMVPIKCVLCSSLLAQSHLVWFSSGPSKQ